MVIDHDDRWDPALPKEWQNGEPQAVLLPAIKLSFPRRRELARVFDFGSGNLMQVYKLCLEDVQVLASDLYPPQLRVVEKILQLAEIPYEVRRADLVNAPALALGMRSYFNY